MLKLAPVNQSASDMSGKPMRRSWRRPKVSLRAKVRIQQKGSKHNTYIVTMAGKAKSQLQAPQPSDAPRAANSVAPASLKMDDE